MTGPTNPDGDPPATSDRPIDAEQALAAIRAVALRLEAGRRLVPPTTQLLLRSIVEATVALFDAEASSIALYDATTGQLVFQVAAGSQGEGVVGVAIPPDQGIAGYAYTTGQPLALSDVARDARFGRAAAEQTGYVPRSVVAVPLLDDEGSIGVLEVLDKRSEAAFDLRDIELASVFARQATVAIRASRLERDAAALLASALTAIASGDADSVDAVVADAVASLAGEEDGALWAVADEIARLRAADPAELDLVRELLAVLVQRAERASEARARRRTAR
ncbi:MAG TPA: GAF domain-containing protein [Candidatus Limnocylindrales bacterium]|nr:GAF domain-containing protein [Candidatus Limnocylindrales bacterium]